MIIRLGLCQLAPEPGDPETNAEAVCELLDAGDADVLILPEMFLTGYGTDASGLKEKTEDAVRRISDKCRETGRAAAVGAPR